MPITNGAVDFAILNKSHHHLPIFKTTGVTILMDYLFDIYVQPGAKKTEVTGKHDGRLKIRLKAAPIEGKANQELINFFANFFKLRKQDISITQGEKSRYKTVLISATPEVIQQIKALVHNAPTMPDASFAPKKSRD